MARRGRKPAGTKEELINLFKNKAAELGRAPTAKEINDDPRMPSASCYNRQLGGIKKTAAAADVPMSRRSGGRRSTPYPDEELLEQLRKKATQLQRRPTSRDIMADPNMASTSTFTLRFGSLKLALILAGVK